MVKINKYGSSPYDKILVHGGPGAAGELGDLAIKLSSKFNLIEQLQTEASISGQIGELHLCIDRYMEKPVDILGFSWGAWLSCIYASKNPDCVNRLVLISCPPFEDSYASDIMDTRLKRLKESEKKVINIKIEKLNKSSIKDIKNRVFEDISRIIFKADSFDSVMPGDLKIDYDYNIYDKVWEEVEYLRRSGRLKEIIGKIENEIILIHGSYDPHPSQGVIGPLKAQGKDITPIVLDKCGHYPWREKNAKKKFYDILYRYL